MAVDWLADGRLDVSRARARFATGLDTSLAPPPLLPPNINVRWVDGQDADRRRGLEQHFGLEAGNEEAPATWSYVLADASRENIIALVQHPDVEDTHNINRAEMTLAAGAFPEEVPPYQPPCGLAQHDERVMDLNAQFAFVASACELGCRHERPVHGDLNLGHVPGSQHPGGQGNTAKAPSWRIGQE